MEHNEHAHAEHNHSEHASEDNGNQEEEFSTEEIAVAANDKVDILLDLLVKKGVITEEEYNKELDKFYDEMDEE